MRTNMKTAILFLAAIAAFAQVRDASPRVPSSGTVAQMNAISTPVDNMRFTITDALTSTDVSTGGGSTRVDAVYNGAAWVLAPSSGSGSMSTLAAGVFVTGMAQSATRYHTLGADTIDATQGLRQVPLNRAGTLRNLYVRLLAAVGGSGQTITVTLQVAGSDTSITCQIASGADTCNDTSHSAAVTAGQLFGVKYVTTGTTGTLYPTFSVSFE